MVYRSANFIDKNKIFSIGLKWRVLIKSYLFMSSKNYMVYDHLEVHCTK